MGHAQKKVRICRTLFDAVRINDRLAVEVLLIFGAQVNRRDSRGWTALHHAAWHNCGEIFSYLLSQGADPKTLTFAGERPLDLAIRNNAWDITGDSRKPVRPVLVTQENSICHKDVISSQ